MDIPELYALAVTACDIRPLSPAVDAAPPIARTAPASPKREAECEAPCFFWCWSWDTTNRPYLAAEEADDADHIVAEEK